MGLKDVISGFMQRRAAKSEKYRQMDEDHRLNKTLSERQLSANERELNSYKEDRRKAFVDRMLAAERQRRQHSFLQGPKVYKQKDIFKQHRSIMTNSKAI